MMRTTVTIDEDVLRDAKRRAAESGISLSQLIERALRDTLTARAQQPCQRFHMLTNGGGQPRVNHSPADLYGELDKDDVDAYRSEE